MLAENTDIDARTRWRDATTILQDDARYKNVEDPRDREELFQEFIVELEKKEKEDQRRAREAAVAQFNRLLQDYAEEGKINRKSIWADCKKLFLEVIVKSDYRALDDSDFRRCFQSFTAELEESFRAVEKRKRLEFERSLVACQGALRTLLENFAHSGLLTVDVRWKELAALDAVAHSEALKNLKALFASAAAGEGEGSDSNSKYSQAAKDVFDSVQAKVYEQFKQDKRLVKDVLGRQDWKVEHTSTFADFKALLLRVARVQEVDPKVAVAEGPSVGSNVDASTNIAPTGNGSVVNVKPMQVLVEVEPVVRGAGGGAEEGEEVEDEQVRAMLLERPAALALVFQDLHTRAVADFQEEQARTLKVEKKFLSVLAENFYLQEHATMPWEDAKKVLQRRSVYDDLSKADKKRLFAQHMAELAAGGGKTKGESLLLPPRAAKRSPSRDVRDTRDVRETGGGRDKRQRSSSSYSYSRPRDRRSNYAHASGSRAHSHRDVRDASRDRGRDREREEGGRKSSIKVTILFSALRM